MLLSLLLGCAEQSLEDSALAPSCTEGETMVLVVSTVAFARPENGISWGFDIDQHVSESDDDEGCFKSDFTDPYGNEGVDNAFATLLPVLEMTEAAATEAIIQNSINNGELLMLLEISGIQDRQNDECVTVNLFRSHGTPLVGTDGTLLDGQTFERALDLPHAVVHNVAIVDGWLDAVPLDIELPVQILDHKLDLLLTDGGFHIELAADGSAQGFLGGAVPLQLFADILDLPNVNLPENIAPLILSAGDLFPDEQGTCQDISVAFQYQGIPAHFYAED